MVGVCACFRKKAIAGKYGRAFYKSQRAAEWAAGYSPDFHRIFLSRCMNRASDLDKFRQPALRFFPVAWLCQAKTKNFTLEKQIFLRFRAGWYGGC